MDPDPGGPKTYGSDGSGTATLQETAQNFEKRVHKIVLELLFTPIYL
jgi:hypothetical protein